MFKDYYHLTKPGIIRGNALVAIAAFVYASDRHVDLWKLLAMALGTSLIIASSCVINNYIDRDIDRKMARTKKRALVTGDISVRGALIYAGVLGLVGFVVLAVWVNILTLLVGISGMFFYVVVYGYAKRKSVHGTVVGSISGALPPVAGYVAVTNRLDRSALILFLILVFWQMPHFYAIAMYRLNDYKKAKIPVLPAVKGMRATKIQIMLYIIGFIMACASLYIFGKASFIYLITMTVIGWTWFAFGIKGWNAHDDSKWARQMFFISLIVLLVFSAMLFINPWLS